MRSVVPPARSCVLRYFLLTIRCVNEIFFMILQFEYRDINTHTLTQEGQTGGFLLKYDVLC